jgi:hypothetical protein
MTTEFCSFTVFVKKICELAVVLMIISMSCVAPVDPFSSDCPSDFALHEQIRKAKTPGHLSAISTAIVLTKLAKEGKLISTLKRKQASRQQEARGVKKETTFKCT